MFHLRPDRARRFGLLLVRGVRMDAIYTGWKEIAKRLSISRSTAKYWDKAHGLPVIRPAGASVLMRESDLQAWLDAHADRLSHEQA